MGAMIALPRPLLPVVVAPMVFVGTSLHAQVPSPVRFEAAANLVGQATGEDEIRSEVVGSLDLFTDVRVGPISVHVYVEGNTSPRSGGVSQGVPFANMDAGTALGADGDGRIQLSELRIAWPLHPRATVHAGLMDLTGFVDVSRISNDENLFFLGQPFVNNPTIIFPDYTVGAALLLGLPQVPRGQIALTVASSHGLADNPRASYGELFDLDAPGKGTFVAGRFRWEAEGWEGSVGAWTSSADRSSDIGAAPLPTHGLYSVLGISSGVHSLNGRIGLALGDDGSEPFLGITYLGSVGANALGVGLSKTPALPSFVGRTAQHAEAFLRRSIRDLVYLTSSVQHLSPDYFPDGLVSGGIWIFGFRLSAAL